jgi:seryl-tRNA synthetase
MPSSSLIRYICSKFRNMLQVSVLKAAPERVKQQLAKKHFKQPELVDAIIQTDDERKKVQAAFDDTQAKVNAASKEIGQLMAKGDKEGAENIKQNVANWKQTLEPFERANGPIRKGVGQSIGAIT